jgi:hypothetical protein
MRTAEVLETAGGWAAAHERRRCAQPDCENERGAERHPRGLCPACALDAELFDRESRWEALGREILGPA